jgi:hypothetical protein
VLAVSKILSSQPETAQIFARAYLLLLSKNATNPASVAHLVASEDSPDSGSERLDFLAGSPMTCAGREITARPEGVRMPDDLIQHLHVLRHASLEDLRAEHEKVFGQPSKSRNRQQLFVKIAKRVQEESLPPQPEGDGSKPTLVAKMEPKRRGRSKNVTKATVKSATKGERKKRSRVRPVGSRDPRLPKPGTTIERTYKGKKLLVTVEEDGFTFGGKPYRSLSALAQYVTGSTAINGFLFFRLGDYAKPTRRGAKEKSGQ